MKLLKRGRGQGSKFRTLQPSPLHLRFRTFEHFMID